MSDKKLPSDRLDPFYLFSSYPSEILNRETNLYITKDITSLDIHKLYKLKSIEFANPAIPNIKKIIEIYDIVNEKKSTNIEIVSSNTNIDVKEIYRIIIWLIKFGYISLIEE